MSGFDRAAFERRARESLGTSAQDEYSMVARAFDARGLRGGTLLDVACGTGNLHREVGSRFDEYLGLDLVRHPGFPEELAFVQANANGEPLPLPDARADVVAAIGCLLYMHNPRAFVRELVRVTRPGGHVLVSVTNQLSLVSKGSFLLRHEFPAFRDVWYASQGHVTALLEQDVIRIFNECGLEKAQVFFSERGRIALTARTFPRALSRRWPRAFSDSLVVVGSKPSSDGPRAETALRSAP